MSSERPRMSSLQFMEKHGERHSFKVVPLPMGVGFKSLPPRHSHTASGLTQTKGATRHMARMIGECKPGVGYMCSLDAATRRVCISHASARPLYVARVLRTGRHITNAAVPPVFHEGTTAPV